MSYYSTIIADETDKIDRLNSFFSGEPMPPKDTGERDLGMTGAEAQRRRDAEEAAIMSALDSMLDGDDTAAQALSQPVNVGFVLVPNFMTHDDDELPEKIYVQPTWISPYDRAFIEVRRLEAARETASHDDRPKIEADLVDAIAAWDIEKERSLDDRYRKFHRIDRHRAGEGREDYNATRRTVRDQANAMTPKEALAAMSPDERAAHRRAQKAASARKSRAKAKVAKETSKNL